MPELSASIEIEAPPETVREKFLDFSKLPVYHKDGFFRSIEPANPNKPLEPGDKLHNVLQGMTFDPIFLENSPTRYQWVGTVPYIFTGLHTFKFEPSAQFPGGTRFTQEEQFTGLVSFVMGDNIVGRWIGMRARTQEGWNRYNKDLKAWCEESIN